MYSPHWKFGYCWLAQLVLGKLSGWAVGGIWQEPEVLLLRRDNRPNRPHLALGRVSKWRKGPPDWLLAAVVSCLTSRPVGLYSVPSVTTNFCCVFRLWVSPLYRLNKAQNLKTFFKSPFSQNTFGLSTSMKMIAGFLLAAQNCLCSLTGALKYKRGIERFRDDAFL